MLRRAREEPPALALYDLPLIRPAPPATFSRQGRRESCAAALGISQEELALRIGADQAYVSRIEAGRMNVTLETAQAIAAALDSDVAALLAGTGKAGEG